MKNFVRHKTNAQVKNYFLNLNKIDNSFPINWNKAKPFSQLPGPKPLPLIGNFWRFLPFFGEYCGKNLMQINQYNYKTYGDIYILRELPGTTDIVFLQNPEDIENLHRNEGVWPIRKAAKSLSYYRNVLRKEVFNGVSGLSAVHGEDWYNLRSAVNPILLQPRVVQQYIQSMDKIAGQFVENIKFYSKLNEKGEMPSNFLNEIFKWSLESVAVVALDKHLGCLNRNLPLNSEQQNLINSTSEMFKLMNNLDNGPALWMYFSTKDWKKFVEVSDFITNTTLKYIDEAIDKMDHHKEEQRKSVLQKLIKKDRQIAIAIVLDMISAGIDTTGKSLATILYHLATNQEAQRTLRQELQTLFKDKNQRITTELLSQAHFLKATIRESTRLAPVAIGNARVTVKNLVLGGYQIPRDTNIVTLLIFASHDKKYFKNPAEFKPERWLRATENEFSYKNSHTFASQPFGFGPRSCIGRRLANLQLEVALTKIILSFEIFWPFKPATFNLELLYGISDDLKFHVKQI